MLIFICPAGHFGEIGCTAQGRDEVSVNSQPPERGGIVAALGKGATGEVNMVRRSKKEDSFSEASAVHLDWKIDVRAIGKQGRGNTLWRDQEIYTPMQLQSQNMNIQRVYKEAKY